MTMDPRSEEQVEREAAEWFTRLHSGDASADTRQQFEFWLQSGRANKVAYCDCEQVYRDLDYVATAAGLDFNFPIEDEMSHPGPSIATRRRKSIVATAAAAMAIAAVALVTFSGPHMRAGHADLPALVEVPDYQTEIAEIIDLVLEDGSIVTLGAKSLIETEFTETRRQVTLLEGEAFFDVTPDPNRPFFVAAQDTLVRVVGTKFDVKRSADIVHVSVLEGIVEVMKPNDIEAAIASANTDDVSKQVLLAGDRVSAARRVALPETRQIEQVEPGAWRSGRLAYEDASLAEIVADLNRYYDHPIRLASSDVGDLRSTLAFQTTEIDQVLDVMTAIHPIKVQKLPSGEIVLSRVR